MNNIVKEKKIIPIKYFNTNIIFRCFEKYNIKDFKIIYALIDELDDLDLWEKNLLLTRFIHIYKYIKNYYIYICRCYSLSKLFIIVVGIINPALLSINHDQNNRFYVLIYWSVWILQLVVSILTALISFFKWDKKYFLYTSYKTKIEQEIWLYLELTGKYNILETDYEIRHNKTNHSTKLKTFLNKIESLYKKLKDSDLEIEDIDEDNDNKSSNNDTNQLLKSELNVLDKNDNDDYQQYIISQLKILLNDIKPQINELISLKSQNKNTSEKEKLLKNKISTDLYNIKNGINDINRLKTEIELFFNNNNIQLEYISLFNI